MPDYDPKNWFWVVGDDESRAWSSAQNAYVQSWDSARMTRIASEQTLSEVLRPYGLRGPYISADDVRTEAQRRIIALTGTTDIVGCLIKQHNAQMRATELTLIKATGGTWTAEQAAEAAALQGMANAIKAIRAASNVLEATLPANYEEDIHWPSV
jgi:hypothetical protein